MKSIDWLAQTAIVLIASCVMACVGFTAGFGLERYARWAEQRRWRRRQHAHPKRWWE